MSILLILASLLFNTFGVYYVLFLNLIPAYGMYISLIIPVLNTVGYFFLFKKCGQAPWKALIPCYREYALAQCGDRELEGRYIFWFEVATSACFVSIIAMTLFSSLNNTIAMVLLFLVAITFIVLLFRIMYSARVGMGLAENFGSRKVWITFFILLLPFVPVLYWAFDPKKQPKWKVPEIEADEKLYFSGRHAETLGKGLTVNIEERTAREFFKTKYLLRDVHMQIKPGSMVLLLGGSGAGKTTLISAINGYEKAKADVTLDNENIYREYKRMQYKIGFVPQQDLMRSHDTVRHTLSDAATLRLPGNFSREDRKNRVEEVMKIFGLTPVANSMVSKLSGGQRKRLSISVEFLSNPTLFILDEPDSGLDGVMARELMEQLRQIADQGKVVIVITHTPDRVIDLFDDVIVLAKDANRTGRLAYYGSIEEARVFFGKDKMEEIVKSVNRSEEGGEGRADEFIRKYAEVQHV